MFVFLKDGREQMFFDPLGYTAAAKLRKDGHSTSKLRVDSQRADAARFIHPIPRTPLGRYQGEQVGARLEPLPFPAEVSEPAMQGPLGLERPIQDGHHYQP